nr:hypothetical protein [uncultured Lachnoclostridium sp.]
MNFDGLAGAGIPYLNMMKKAMPKEEPKKKKVKSHRLTEIDPKSKKPRLKKGVSMDRAVEVLFMFENEDVTPNQIEDMKITIENLRNRVKKLEDW